jgi:hypothetical protein
MPFEFEKGKGSTRHAAIIHGKHGQDYVYYVRAIDQYGNAMDSSAVVSFKIDVSSAPRFWKDIEYDITSWKSGIAPLGFGSGEVKTTINNVRTVYFRHEFNLENASSITYFSMIVKYDNGFAVYLNGKEVSRINLPFGELSYDNWAIDASGGFKALTLDVTQLGLLRSGKNVIAVELHQSENDQADMLFDLRALNPNPIIEFGSNWHYFDEGREPEVQTGSTGVKISDRAQPDKFMLYQNYPNPFNPKTQVRYQLAQSGQVELSVYNLLGERVATLVNERQNPGNYFIQFDASDLASGIYFYHLKTERFNQVKKMLVIR